MEKFSMKLLVVYKHNLFRESLRHLLMELDTDLLVLEASDFNQALNLIDSHSDLYLVLLDLSIPDIDGFAALDVLNHQYPRLSVVVLSDSENYNDMKRAITAGAEGFISKSYTGSVLASTLLPILSGKTHLPAKPFLLSSATPLGQSRDATTALTDEGFKDLQTPCHLTRRQLDVLALLERGKSNKEIARSLELAEGTVKTHCMAIFRELGVNNRTQAVLRAKNVLPSLYAHSNYEESKSVA